MVNTFNKRSDISLKDEKPSTQDNLINTFVLHFGYSKLFRISDFEIRICNLLIMREVEPL